MKHDPLFYIAHPEQQPSGPYDLVQMADFLSKKLITGETMARLDGDTGWKPFALYPQFDMVNSMCPEKVTTPFDGVTQDASSPIISRETTQKLAKWALLLAIICSVSFATAFLNLTAGWVILIVGIAITGISQALILGRMLQEDFPTIGLVFSIPFYDVFYYFSNIDEYIPYFFAKYGGIAMVLSAIAGQSAGGFR